MEGDGVWRGGRAYGGLREGESEGEGPSVGAGWVAVLYLVDLKRQKNMTNSIHTVSFLLVQFFCLWLLKNA